MFRPYLLDGAGRQGVIDGLSSVAGAYSLSRNLAASFNGNLFNAASFTLADQTGQGNSISGAGTPPTLIQAAGPNNRRALLFANATSPMGFGVAGTDPLSKYISASAGYVAVSVIPTSFVSGNAFWYQNDGIVADTGGFFGMMSANLNSGEFECGLYDGAAKKATSPVVANTPYVLTWRHDSGTLYCSVNGTVETSVAAGNITTMTGQMRLGKGFGNGAAFYFFELAIFSTAPPAGQRAKLIKDMGSWIGAAV